MKAILLILTALVARPVIADPLDQCRQRVMDYAYYWDQGDPAGMATVFTAEAILDLAGNRFAGIDAITERMLSGREGTVLRHLMSTVRVSGVDDTTASGVSYVTVYAAKPTADGLPGVEGFALMGEYHDTFALVGTECLIAERRLEPVMRQIATDQRPAARE